jgi:hypothetical protein
MSNCASVELSSKKKKDKRRMLNRTQMKRERNDMNQLVLYTLNHPAHTETESFFFPFFYGVPERFFGGWVVGNLKPEIHKFGAFRNFNAAK